MVIWAEQNQEFVKSPAELAKENADNNTNVIKSNPSPTDGKTGKELVDGVKKQEAIKTFLKKNKTISSTYEGFLKQMWSDLDEVNSAPNFFNDIDAYISSVYGDVTVSLESIVGFSYKEFKEDPEGILITPVSNTKRSYSLKNIYYDLSDAKSKDISANLKKNPSIQWDAEYTTFLNKLDPKNDLPVLNVLNYININQELANNTKNTLMSNYINNEALWDGFIKNFTDATHDHCSAEYVNSVESTPFMQMMKTILWRNMTRNEYDVIKSGSKDRWYNNVLNNKTEERLEFQWFKKRPGNKEDITKLEFAKKQLQAMYPYASIEEYSNKENTYLLVQFKLSVIGKWYKENKSSHYDAIINKKLSVSWSTIELDFLKKEDTAEAVITKKIVSMCIDNNGLEWGVNTGYIDQNQQILNNFNKNTSKELYRLKYSVGEDYNKSDNKKPWDSTQYNKEELNTALKTMLEWNMNEMGTLIRPVKLENGKYIIKTYSATVWDLIKGDDATKTYVSPNKLWWYTYDNDKKKTFFRS